MAIKPALTQFNGGEISPQLEGRIDWDKYNYSAKLCKNFIPLVEGSLKRRGGTHFVAQKKQLEQCSLNIEIVTIISPVLKINGVIYPTTRFVEGGADGFYYVYKSGNVWITDGDKVSIEITCPNFDTINDTFILEVDTTKKYTLQTQGSENITLTVLKPDSCSLKLNNEERSSITVKNGDVIEWEALFNNQKGGGSLRPQQDTTAIIYIKNGIPQITTSDIINDGIPRTDKYYLIGGKYDVELVGGGSGGSVSFEAESNKYWHHNGYSAPAIVGRMQIPEGEYEFSIGALGASGLETTTNTKGGETYIKTASGDAVADCSVLLGLYLYRIMPEYLVGETTAYINRGSYVSAYKGYGQGSHYTIGDDSTNRIYDPIPGTAGYIKLTYVGE